MTESQRLIWANVFSSVIINSDVNSWRNCRSIVIQSASKLADEVLSAIDENIDTNDSLCKFMKDRMKRGKR